MFKFKSSFLSSVRPFYAPDDEKGVEKSDAEKQRDTIKVTNSDGLEKKENDEDKLDKKDDKEGDEKGKDADKEGDEDGEDEGEEKEGEEGEEKELTVEQKEIAS